MPISTPHQSGRLCWLMLFVSLVGLASTNHLPAQSSGQIDFPYQAFVLDDNVAVHSGPGQVHYATEAMKQGGVVEVYRHDPGGWCAIRPVEGSFSLVPEATLEIVSEGVGRIKVDGTQAWVGTKLGPVEKPLWQVKLNANEMVEVLGQISWPDPAGHSAIWYQIAPPAGEFRWIRMSDIQLPAAPQVATLVPARPILPNGNPAASQSVRSLIDISQSSPALHANATLGIDSTIPSLVTQATLQTDQPSDVRTGTRNINHGWRPATGNRQNNMDFSEDDDSIFNGNGLPSAEFVSGFATANANVNQMRFADANPTQPNLALGLTAIRNSALMQVNMNNLELQLTREMIKQPVNWKLTELSLAANHIYRNSADPGERSLAQRFLAKIENCQKIQAGYAGANRSSANVSAASNLVGSGVRTDVQLGTTYDAHGWLTEMVRDGGASRSSYALQDDSGKITHHISPAPGMNLHRYLKSKVGIIGQRGYHNRLKLDHVTAHRVVELEPAATRNR